ncbi:hypothetical protein GETHOR_26190 [Geothrix oryzae]|uniref:Uncharacterized protein n=1 Tax=Geothrix oryzae TaxID=2927975 RepID=A0ABM8DTZ9_9BACT|nr:hypothetical protein [Geothrix oryzae]BDU70518.1 hypothetical protein GETHOR_26190 [Geothrix oryzae]
MARKPNYNFEKRQKDLARQKKKEEKLQKKALKKDALGNDIPDSEDQEGVEGQDETPEGGQLPE